MGEEQEDPGNVVRCPGCGAEIPKGKSFCRFCGKAVGDTSSTAVPVTSHMKLPAGQTFWLAIGILAIIGVVVLAIFMVPGIIGPQPGKGPQPGPGPTTPFPPPTTQPSTVQTPRYTTAQSIPATVQQQATRPVDTFPPKSAVSVGIGQKDTSYATIPVTFNGGDGQTLVHNITVRMTRSDGRVVTSDLRPESGAEVTLEGTRGTDRVEVFVTYYSGKTLLIADQDVSFRALG